MNTYTTSALAAFIVFGMGVIALFLGFKNFLLDSKSRKRRHMLYVFICVFFWDAGYAWMSLTYDDFFAYIFRAVALLSVTFYMFFILIYASMVTKYPRKRLMIFEIIFLIASLVAWTQIIGPGAVEFMPTPWGYWYKSHMTWARVIQFVSIIAAIVQYYLILGYGKNHASLKRDKYIIKQFQWFGVVLFVGYIFDTLLPTMAKIPAIPGSSISAFFSALILYFISYKSQTFGLTKENVSEYVFNDVDVPVIVTDYEGYTILANNAAKEYLGKNEGGMQGLKLEDFIAERTEDNDYSVMGTSKTCQVKKTEVKDQFGEILYNVIFLQDVTEQHMMIEEIKSSRKQAEEANMAKSTFLANMSHEIRTPINAVLGLDEMILRESDNDNIMGYAADIEVAGKNLLAIINDILDFSKIESGKMDLVPVEYDISSLLNDSYNTVSLRAKNKGLKLYLENDPDMPCVLMGDEVRIRQILNNILSNAVKYTKEGSVDIRAKVEIIDNKTEPIKVGDIVNLVVSVKDTGIGMTPEQKEELFNPFIRFDEKANRNIEGTGLGMTITKRFVDLMNGEIEIDSVRGEGSVFVVKIPQKVVKTDAIGNIGAKIGSNASHILRYEEHLIAPDAKILVVDDVPMNLKVFKGLLKKTQMQITTCLSGRECLELIKDNKFDIIFLDHMMPEMDGIETFHRLKEDKTHFNQDTPIVMLTANAIVGVEDEYMQEGFDGYLSKPIQWQALEDTIRKYLD